MGGRWFRRLAQVAGMVVFAGMHADGKTIIRPVDVVLYVDGIGYPPGPVDLDARVTVKRMYERLGISLVWREGSPKRGVVAGTVIIQIRFTRDSPRSASANALAFALPFADGANAITVMYKRIDAIADGNATLARCLLAHVLAHEIGHVLQGTNMHSETGVMQAEWNGPEYRAMVRRPLEFTREDAVMIVKGLAAWKLRAAGEPAKP